MAPRLIRLRIRSWRRDGAVVFRIGSYRRGEGKMAVATKISFDKKKNQIELENYSSEPVRLNNLELEVKK